MRLRETKGYYRGRVLQATTEDMSFRLLPQLEYKYSESSLESVYLRFN